MKEVSKNYIVDIEGYADISVEISSNGAVRVVGWPNHSVAADQFCKVLRLLADNIDEIRNNA